MRFLLLSLMLACAPTVDMEPTDDGSDFTDTDFTDVPSDIFVEAPEVDMFRQPVQVIYVPELGTWAKDWDGDGVVAQDKVPCVHMGRCPAGEQCKFDQDEQGNKSEPYCVDTITQEKTENKPRKWWSNR